jgi:hypothetical protein
MPRETPVHHWPVLIVNVSDGAQFTCCPYEVRGVKGAIEIRWQLTDSKGRHYVGPTCIAGESPADVQRRVTEWWESYGLLH